MFQIKNEMVTKTDVFQLFTALPLPEQLKVSQQINQFLLQYIEKISNQTEDAEKNQWNYFSKQQLANAFGADEPVYEM